MRLRSFSRKISSPIQFTIALSFFFDFVYIRAFAGPSDAWLLYLIEISNVKSRQISAAAELISIVKPSLYIGLFITLEKLILEPSGLWQKRISRNTLWINVAVLVSMDELCSGGGRCDRANDMSRN